MNDLETLTLPTLPWKPDALDPVISARTIEFHHGKHHKTYVEKAQGLIKGTDLESASLPAVVQRAHDTGNKALFNNAAQVWNHTLYWHSLRPNGGGKPAGDLAAAIERDFGGLDGLRKKWSDAAVGQFGSGWAWLVVRKGGKLDIEATANADTPLVRGDTPILTIDVWEHAYYLDWQNRRPDHVNAILDKLIDWEAGAQRYAAAKK